MRFAETFNCGKRPFAEALVCVYDHAMDVMAITKPDLAIAEDVYFGVNAKTFKAMVGALSAITLAAERSGVPLKRAPQFNKKWGGKVANLTPHEVSAIGLALQDVARGHVDGVSRLIKTGKLRLDFGHVDVIGGDVDD